MFQKNKILLSDGAMATLLLKQGFTGCLEALVLDQPQSIEAAHEAYIAAGSRVILTHTFGANRFALRKHGIEDKVVSFNGAAVDVARSAVAGRDVEIVGCMGPSQLSGEELAQISSKELQEGFVEQAGELLKNKVSALLLETFHDAIELEIALQAVLRLQPQVPVIASLALKPDGTAYGRGDFKTFVDVLQKNSPDVVGINCSEPPQLMFSIFKKLKKEIQKPFWIKLNTGLPGQLLSEFEFAEQCALYQTPGVVAIGGCCGTTPDYIKRLSEKFS